MFKKLNILDESDKHLRMKSKDVTFPLSKEDKQTIQQIIKHLTYSQIEEYAEKYDAHTEKIEAVRKARTDLLDGANLPLEGLSVEDGELTYKGFKWDNLSGADQMKVGVAIVRKLNPKCGFVLLDKLEQMDIDTLNEFGHWLQQEDLQVIATRVSTGDECSIIIEDGYSKSNDKADAAPQWKAGEF